MNSQQSILLIRHGEVESKWKGVCYGAMDVLLSPNGKVTSSETAMEVCQAFQSGLVYHSGLSRTRFLAERIVELSERGVEIREDMRLRERNYGNWQGLSWDEAYNSDPDNFHGLIEEPDTYRPPEGETTTEMQRRAVDWFNEQKNHGNNVIAISHSGPIAALAGHVLELKPTEWTPWLTKNLQTLEFRCVESSKWIVQNFGLSEKDL